MMIQLIALTEIVSNNSTSNSFFQHLLIGSISLETRSGVVVELGTLGVGVNPSSQGTQESFHTSMELPSPTLKHVTILIVFLRHSIAL